MPAQLPPNGIRYEWVEDTRQGYEGTAVVNITWEPQEGYEFISSYKIILFSQTEECGGQMKMLSFVGIGKVRIVETCVTSLVQVTSVLAEIYTGYIELPFSNS